MDWRLRCKLIGVLSNTFCLALVGAALSADGWLADIVRAWTPLLLAVAATGAALFSFLDKGVADFSAARVAEKAAQNALVDKAVSALSADPSLPVILPKDWTVTTVAAQVAKAAGAPQGANGG